MNVCTHHCLQSFSICVKASQIVFVKLKYVVLAMLQNVVGLALNHQDQAHI